MTFDQNSQNQGTNAQSSAQPTYEYGAAAPQVSPAYQYGANAAAGAMQTAIASAAANPTINTAMINPVNTAEHQEAVRVSMGRAYAEMFIGLVITTIVAAVGEQTGLFEKFLTATGIVGMIVLIVAQIALAWFLGMKIMSISSGTSRVLFYVYAALMGFTLSTVFITYDLGTVALAFGITAAFFFVLTMFALTTKINVLKYGPVLFAALIVLIISQIVLAFIGTPGFTRLICAVGLVIFAGMTMYDTQKLRAMLNGYASQGAEMVKRASIFCAVSLYIDFVNIFLYILQLLGSRD